MKEKYADFDCSYIESNNYYLIIGNSKDVTKEGVIEDIMYKNEYREFEFFSSGPVPLHRRKKTIVLKKEGFVGFCSVYYYNGEYIIHLERNFGKGYANAADYINQWEKIIAPFPSENDFGTQNERLKIEHYFKVIKEVDDDYEVFAEIEGE